MKRLTLLFMGLSLLLITSISYSSKTIEGVSFQQVYDECLHTCKKYNSDARHHSLLPTCNNGCAYFSTKLSMKGISRHKIYKLIPQ